MSIFMRMFGTNSTVNFCLLEHHFWDYLMKLVYVMALFTKKSFLE